MANEIYKQTHKGLAEMISARAATNVLQKALKANACDADMVDYPRMKSCLQGYVFEELRNVLPSHGLKRQIKGILRDLGALSEAEKRGQPEVAVISEPDTVAVEGIVEEAAMAVSEPHSFMPNQTDVAAAKDLFAASTKPVVAVAEAENYDSIFNETLSKKSDDTDSTDLIIEDMDLLRIGDSSTSNRHDDISDEMFELPGQISSIIDEEEMPEVDEIKAKAAEVQTPKKPIVRKKQRESIDFSSKKLSDLEALIQVFALVEGTRAVAIVHSNGKLVSSRGKGYDLDSLAKLSNMALTLLKKSGNIRSFHLFVDDSQLFLFPVGEHMIVVVGSEEINFGEIVSAFAAFEEEK